MKFGGTSVATLPRWQNIRELVASRRAEGARVLVVVSALTGITDALKQMCAQEDKGKRVEAARAIAQRHYDLLDHMQLAVPATLAERLSELAKLAPGHEGLTLGELTTLVRTTGWDVSRMNVRYELSNLADAGLVRYNLPVGEQPRYVIAR